MSNDRNKGVKMREIELGSWVNPIGNLEQWLTDNLSESRLVLGMKTGIVSSTSASQYKILACNCASTEMFRKGMSFNLGTTFCEAVVSQKTSVYYNRVGEIPDLKMHPCYEHMNLESYICAPIFTKEGDVFGTINFSSDEVRPQDFGYAELNYIERIADVLRENIAGLRELDSTIEPVNAMAMLQG